MISKELLEIVLDTSIDETFYYNDNLLWFESDGREFNINVYELAHKCKEWAYKNNYDIWSITWGAVEFHNIKKYNGTERINADTEPEAIFKACEWILEQNQEYMVQLKEDKDEYIKIIKGGIK